MFEHSVDPQLVKRDFVNTAASHFPAHGWATNSQNRRVLWLPLIGLCSRPWLYRENLGLTDLLPVDKPASRASETMTFLHPKCLPQYGTDSAVELAVGPPSTEPLLASLKLLQIALGKLVSLHNYVNELPVQNSIDRQVYVDELTANAELLVKFAFTELRIFLDLLAYHLAPVLFENWKKDRCETFPTLARKVEDIKDSEPLLCNREGLKAAFASAVTWFSIIRGPSGGYKGIRDQLVHSNCRVLVSVSGEIPEKWSLYARILPAGTPEAEDLFGTLQSLLGEMCKFCAAIHKSCVKEGAYAFVDAFPIFMDDRAQTAFWPEIVGTCSTEPNEQLSDK